MFSQLNNAMHKNKGIFITIFGLLTLTFIVTMSDVSLSDVTSGKFNQPIGVVNGRNIDKAEFADLRDSANLSYNLENPPQVAGQFATLNDSEGARNLILTSLARREQIKNEISAKRFEQPEISIEDIRAYATKKKITPEVLKALRETFHVSGEKLDAVIKELVLFEKYYAHFDEKATANEEDVQKQAALANAEFTIRAKTYPAVDAIDEVLVKYFQDNQENYKQDDLITAQFVRFNKDAAGKLQAQTFASTAKTQVLSKAFETIASATKLKVENFGPASAKALNSGRLIAGDLELTNAALKLTTTAPVSSIVEGDKNNFVIYLKKKGGILAFAQLRQQIMADYYGETRLKTVYEERKLNDRRFKTLRKLELSQFTLNPTNFYEGLTASDEDVKAAYDNDASYKVKQLKANIFTVSAKDIKDIPASKAQLSNFKKLYLTTPDKLADALKKFPTVKHKKSGWIKLGDFTNFDKTVHDAAFALEAKQNTIVITSSDNKIAFAEVLEKRDLTPFTEVSKDIKSSLIHDQAKVLVVKQAEAFYKELIKADLKENAFATISALALRFKLNERKLGTVEPDSQRTQFQFLQNGFMSLDIQNYMQQMQFIQQMFTNLGQLNPYSDFGTNENGDYNILVVEGETLADFITYDIAKNICAQGLADSEGMSLAKAKSDSDKAQLQSAADAEALNNLFKSLSFSAEQVVSKDKPLDFAALFNEESIVDTTTYQTVNSANNAEQLINILSTKAGDAEKIKTSSEQIRKDLKAANARELRGAFEKTITEAVKTPTSAQ